MSDLLTEGCIAFLEKHNQKTGRQDHDKKSKKLPVAADAPGAQRVQHELHRFDRADLAVPHRWRSGPPDLASFVLFDHGSRRNLGRLLAGSPARKALPNEPEECRTWRRPPAAVGWRSGVSSAARRVVPLIVCVTAGSSTRVAYRETDDRRSHAFWPRNSHVAARRRRRSRAPPRYAAVSQAGVGKGLKNGRRRGSIGEGDFTYR